MRVYGEDGSFVDDVNDTDFGWYFYEIVIDESDERFDEINKETRYISKLKKSLFKQYESLDIPLFDDPKPILIEMINPNIKIESIFEIEPCRNDEVPCYEEILNSVDINFPPKEKLAKMINPCNAETKMLLSVINCANYRNLAKEKMADDLMKSVNGKSTSFKNLIKEKRASITQDMVTEIDSYHANKEDNMMSLMMELILTNVDGDVEDIVESPNCNRGAPIPQFKIETESDNTLNRSESRLERNESNNYLQVLNRSDILSSIGLSDKDKSIQSFCDETFEMHQELAYIKKSFQEYETKVNDLLKQACALKTDLKETVYLNDIINLLEGNIKNVKLKKLPFRIFYEQIEDHLDLNLIV